MTHKTRACYTVIIVRRCVAGCDNTVNNDVRLFQFLKDSEKEKVGGTSQKEREIAGKTQLILRSYTAIISKYTALKIIQHCMSSLA